MKSGKRGRRAREEGVQVHEALLKGVEFPLHGRVREAELEGGAGGDDGDVLELGHDAGHELLGRELDPARLAVGDDDDLAEGASDI